MPPTSPVADPLRAPASWTARHEVRRRSVVGGLGLALLGGAGLIAAMPPVGLWPLVFVSFVPIAIAQHRLLPQRFAGFAPTIGFGAFIAYMSWGGLPAGQRWWLLLLVPLLAAAGRLDAQAQRATGYRHLWWSSPVVWTSTLFVAGLTPFASWLDPAYALYRQPWLIQPVSVFAVSGLNLVILLTNYGIASAVLTNRRRTRRLILLAVTAMLAIWIGSSALLLSQGRDGRTIRIALVQPGHNAPFAPTSAAAQSSNDAMLAALEGGTRRAAGDGAQLVVWPEKALQYVNAGSDEWRSIQRLVEQSHIYLVVGFTSDPNRFNQAAVFAPTGGVLAIYNKQHPVIFAGDHSVGGTAVVADTRFGDISTIICYDLDFENTARDAARKGAGLLAVPSEDWSGIATQHYTHLVLRAVENRVAAVKADTAWDSAIIDPEGRILAESVDTSKSSALLVETVPIGTGSSLFVTIGNWVGWMSVLLTAVWALLAVTGQRRGAR